MQAIQQDIARPTTPPGTRVFAVGDVHGRIDLLEQLLGMLEEYARSDPREDNILVFLGDYVDRGPSSKAVIERLSRPASKDFDIVCLKGNHEEMMLRFLKGSSDAGMWLLNGGRDTLKSYGVIESDPDITLGSDEGLDKARRALQAVIPGPHLEFLTTLKLMHVEGDYLMVHAGIRPKTPLEEQHERDLIWIRREFLNFRGDFEKVVVHGHSITSTPTIESNRIGIDTGAWRSDILTCLVLDGENRYFLST